MEYYTDFYYSKRDQRKKTAPPDKHIPDKNEARVLRRIMSQTGMSEAEIRSIPKYRKILSQSERRVIDRSNSNHQIYKFLERLMKNVTRDLKLPKEHPSVVAEFKKRVENHKNNSWSRYSWSLRTYSLSNFLKP